MTVMFDGSQQRSKCRPVDKHIVGGNGIVWQQQEQKRGAERSSSVEQSCINRTVKGRIGHLQ